MICLIKLIVVYVKEGNRVYYVILNCILIFKYSKLFE